MKIALVTDTHFGARGDSAAFADYFNRFYYDIFFPYLEKEGIEQIIHLGDIVDRRKYINFATARHLKRFMERVTSSNMKIDVIIGNHDTFYKNSNEMNSMKELFENSLYNIRWHESARDVYFDDSDIPLGICPWICSGNFNETMDYLDNTKAQVLLGHLEIAGFEMYKGMTTNHGFEAKLFEKFDMVMSGHFHHRSSNGNIHYLGTPYEITWSDWDDPRGFHILDTVTRQLTFIENPYKMFHKLHYDDSHGEQEKTIYSDPESLRGCCVKVVVHSKTNPYWFDLFIDSLEKAGVQDLVVVDDHLNLNLDDDTELGEAEDTLTILRNYSASIESRVDKKELDTFLVNLYQEAMTIE